ncbi:hypothetical protein [Legionella israelensis]|uniref:F-box domain-containing protein n=1 Tax=Legionella israelensis TaxID=454 RepID=A0A0W0V2H8_9GAMM|nr:hypothetical protein [Legionella israelensis]KTD14322.1 hypothetical protein Lisr_2550 [Legionella israelensis]QBS09754.1 hypothetical protein E4T55_07710 [Legionella israelensis]SCY43137.1 hypothetical protein SAMN02746069_02421 [Legionella israelensis DSM 19235]STX59294.1 Uncharacterised protein [Legionella israelensis]
MMEDDVASDSSAPQPDYLSDLPDEMLEYIGSFLSDESKSQWSLTSKSMYPFFKAERDNFQKIINRLLTHALQGEQNEIEEIIKANPWDSRWLFYRGTATDFSGRIYEKVTLFQTALLTHNVNLVKIIEPYFDKLPNEAEEKARQFNKAFPNGFPDQTSYDFSTLIQVITTSSDDNILDALEKKQNNTRICEALNIFRKEFTDLSMKEKYFNPQHLIEAFNVYNQQFIPWSFNQLSLFWCQIIGYIQRYLPAYYAQVFCQRLDSLVEEKKSFTRSLTFENDSKVFYPLSSSSSGLGFDYAIFDGELVYITYPYVHLGFEKLCRANTTELLKLQCGAQCLGQPVTDGDTLTSRSCCTIS